MYSLKMSFTVPTGSDAALTEVNPVAVGFVDLVLNRLLYVRNRVHAVLARVHDVNQLALLLFAQSNLLVLVSEPEASMLARLT